MMPEILDERYTVLVGIGDMQAKFMKETKNARLHIGSARTPTEKSADSVSVPVSIRSLGLTDYVTAVTEARQNYVLLNYEQCLAELTCWYNETVATLFGDDEREELRQRYSEKVADLQYERHKALQRLGVKDDNSPPKEG